MIAKAEFPSDLKSHPSQHFSYCCEQIQNAVKNRKHSFHIMQISSFDGEFPQIRSVVLRKFDSKNFELYFHTDLRSPKFSQLQNNNKVGFHLYCANLKLQIRGVGQAEIVNHQSEKYQIHRSGISLSGARCYMGPHHPGKVMEEYSSNIRPEWIQRAPREEELVNGIENFELIKIQVRAVDCLMLLSTGHIRTRTEFLKSDIGRQVRHLWVAP